MGPLGEIFNPGMRHEIEERRSKALRREEEGNARDGDLRIDLDSGMVVIAAPPASADPSDTTDSADEGKPAGERSAGDADDRNVSATSAKGSTKRR